MSANWKGSKTARRRAAFLLGCGGGVLLAMVLMGSAEEPDSAVVHLSIEDVRRENAAGFASVENVAEIVSRNIDATTARTDSMEAWETEQREVLAAALARPPEVRALIIERLDLVSFQMDSMQTATLNDMNRQLDDIDSSLEQRLRTEQERIHAALEADAELVRFFHTHQDTINKAFEARVGQKPWYSTILDTNPDAPPPAAEPEEAPPPAPKPEEEPPTPPGH